jgi:hypothetical protein
LKEQSSDKKSGNDEEHVYAYETARKGKLGVVGQDEKDGDGAQPLDITTKGDTGSAGAG